MKTEIFLNSYFQYHVTKHLILWIFMNLERSAGKIGRSNTTTTKIDFYLIGENSLRLAKKVVPLKLYFSVDLYHTSYSLIIWWASLLWQIALNTSQASHKPQTTNCVKYVSCGNHLHFVSAGRHALGVVGWNVAFGHLVQTLLDNTEIKKKIE